MILGVVLAGGASSRMGRDKALVDVAGLPMINRVAAALEPVVDHVVVAGRTDSIAGYEPLADPVAGRPGPLAGVVAAVGLALDRGDPRALVIAVAVDHPFVQTTTLENLVALATDAAVIPVDEGVRQVTCGVYPAAWEPIAREELDAGGSLQSLLDRMPYRQVGPDEWATWGEDGRSWFSVDDEAALAAGLARYGSAFE